MTDHTPHRVQDAGRAPAYSVAKPWLDDGDLVLYHGDVLTVLRSLPSGIAQTCCTSPPYWGLRSYLDDGHEDKPHELGLEATPTAYITRMVEVFREVRRVLHDDGTLWLNIGDSYASGGAGWRPGNPDKNGGNSNRDGVPVPPGLKPKDLVGIPWRLAFALQNDGWYLRSDIIWAKPNPMPESVTDRPTKAHEYVFLFSKQPRYYWDADAVREPHQWQDPEQLATNAQARQQARCIERGQIVGQDLAHPVNDGRERKGRYTLGVGERALAMSQAGRNLRSVWQIATQPFPEAHFATYPEELVRRCILAGTSERGGCAECGAPWRRVTEVEHVDGGAKWAPNAGNRAALGDVSPSSVFRTGMRSIPQTTGWEPSCTCSALTAPQTVLDPFVGSGTTSLVARKHGRHSIGIDLSAEYLAITARRTQQLSLLGGAA